MLKTEMVAKNPLRAFDQGADGGLSPGQMGLVAARAGSGKTAFLIQVALDSLFRGNKVLHVSVGETVSHVKSWYEEMFRGLAAEYDLEKAREVWREAEENRLILTFRVEAFGVEKLEERLDDLTQQGIFEPRVVLIDRLELGPALHPTTLKLREFARKKGLKVWVSLRSHREAGDLGALVEPERDLFQVIVGLEPGSDATALSILKNPSDSEGKTSIHLDPRTLLLVSDR